MKKSIWNKLLDEIEEYGVDLSVDQIGYVRNALKQAYLEGKIEGLKCGLQKVKFID